MNSDRLFPNPAQPIIGALQNLIDAVGRDQSLHGDILSLDTIRLADQARLILSAHETQSKAHEQDCLNTWMFTASGGMIFPAMLARHGLENSPLGKSLRDTITIEDIASHLSKLCRFNGACGRFMSVAEHSGHVALMVPKEHAAHALLHDAPEYVLGDKTRPVKRLFPAFQLFEDQLLKVILHRFGLALEMPDSVWLADDQVLAHEIMANCKIPEGETLETCGLAPDMELNLRTRFEYFPPDEAKAFFLEAARALLPSLDGSAFASDAARHKAGTRPLGIGGEV